MTAIIRRNPARGMTLFGPGYRPFGVLDEVDAIAKKMFEGNGAGIVHGMDVYREKDDVVVKAEMPGLKKKDIDITIEDNVLTIKAEKIDETAETDESGERQTYISERRFGSYSRSFRMPFDIDTEKISASFKNGLLEMRLPRAEETKPKKIDITVK